MLASFLPFLSSRHIFFFLVEYNMLSEEHGRFLTSALRSSASVELSSSRSIWEAWLSSEGEGWFSLVEDS